NVASGPSAGAEMITFFTGARRCFLASAPLVKRPVDSTTMSAPTEAQSISAGSFTLKTLKLRPLTAMESSAYVTLCGKLPRTESYFKRCARVFESAVSLTATHEMSLSSIAVRMMLRPMRPKPLMPTLMGITSSDGVSEIAAVQERVTAASEEKMLWVAWRKVNAGAKWPRYNEQRVWDGILHPFCAGYSIRSMALRGDCFPAGYSCARWG